MSTDFQMVRTVRRGFAARLPSELISLVLEFANFENAGRKRAWFAEFGRFAHLVCEVWHAITAADYCCREGWHTIRTTSKIMKAGQTMLVGRNEAINLQMIIRARASRPDIDFKYEDSYLSCLQPIRISVGGRYIEIPPWAASFDEILDRQEYETERGMVWKPCPRKLPIKQMKRAPFRLKRSIHP